MRTYYVLISISKYCTLVGYSQLAMLDDSDAESLSFSEVRAQDQDRLRQLLEALQSRLYGQQASALGGGSDTHAEHENAVDDSELACWQSAFAYLRVEGSAARASAPSLCASPPRNVVAFRDGDYVIEPEQECPVCEEEETYASDCLESPAAAAAFGRVWPGVVQQLAPLVRAAVRSRLGGAHEGQHFLSEVQFAGEE